MYTFFLRIKTILSSNFNSALPGKHFDAPPREEIEVTKPTSQMQLQLYRNFQCYFVINNKQEAFKQWQEEADPIKKKENFVEFLKRSVKLSKTDNATMITGVMTPPAAMAAKRYIENVPQLKLMKAFPDAVFVPTATVLGLFSVQISRKILMGKMVS